MVEVFKTSENEKWVQVTVKPTKSKDELIIGDRQQKIRGFGGCFNELGKIALDKLPKNYSNEVYDNLFSPNECNFNFCRLPIGASDYSEIWYSHNECENDFDMKNFSISRDRKYLIPYIREALKRNKNIGLFASPWSPPTWMKTPKVYNYGSLTKTKENLTAYALYLKKFIDEYQKENITINQLHIQNEVMADQKFPSCRWTGDEMRDFIRDYLIPVNLGADIYLGTINGPEQWDRFLETDFNHYVNLIMQDEICKKNVKGVGYQWAGKYALSSTRDEYPNLEIIQTENECGDGNNTWDYAMYVFGLIRHYFRFGATAYTYWNMVLEDLGTSTWGWKQNSMISINGNNIIYNYEYYIMKHFSHFVKEGANYISLEGKWCSNSVAFMNTDGSLVVNLLNPFDEEKEVIVKGYKIKMSKRSVYTMVIAT